MLLDMLAQLSPPAVIETLAKLINTIGKDNVECLRINNQVYSYMIDQRASSIYHKTPDRFEGVKLEVIMNNTIPSFMLILK